MNLCIIPARAGSKRIPNKNIREFCGKPIIEYALEIAKSVFIKPIVYTNDDRIIFKYPGDAELRTNKNADDNASLTDMLLEIEWLQYYDTLCLLLPTAVFVTDEDIRKALAMLKKNDAIISVCKYSHPIQRAFEICNKKLTMVNDKNQFIRTQDLKHTYYDAGQFYIINVKSFLQQKKIFMEKSIPYIVDAVDIDNEEDWGKAEALFEYKRILEG